MGTVGRAGVCMAVAVLGWGFLIHPEGNGSAAEPPAATAAPLPDDTALAAVIRANGGRVPATGDQLWAALRRVGPFAQLPVPFSAVHLNSGLTAPRVVIAPATAGHSWADLTEPNPDGRLFLAANMDRTAGGDPRVTTVEFISWTPSRRRFDFGVIENLGSPGEPRLAVVDAGRCFACHRDRGPILGVRPWSNTAHDDILRYATAGSLRMSGTQLPQAGPFVLPWTRPGLPAARDRIDGMALAAPEAATVDAAVHAGAALRTNRDVFRLLARTPEGRKALGVLLAAVAEPGPLDPIDARVKAALDATLPPGPAFNRVAGQMVERRRAARPAGLLDNDPAALLVRSGVRPRSAFGPSPPVTVPGLTGGSGSRWAARVTPVSPSSPGVQPLDPVALTTLIQTVRAQQASDRYVATLVELGRYDAARVLGRHGLTAAFRPSNPRAFAQPPVVRPTRAFEAVTPALLAATVGLSDGDRRFLARSLADAAARVRQAKVTPAVLARGVFEGPRFADVLAGGPLPDRDEFKDRFVAGLDEVLTTGYGQAVRFAPDRRTYASGPPYEATDEPEAAVVPTSACLRCHEVSGSAKAVRFDPIPPLAFDPFDPAGREAWLRSADPKRKREVLARMVERLATDADMPPEDAPEYDRFRVREAAAFDAAVRPLAAELERVAGR